MSEKKYDEWGVMESTYMLTDRKIDRQTWLEETCPVWGTYINYQIKNEKVPANKFCLWWLGGPSWAMKVGTEVFLIDNYAGPSIVTRYENSGDCKNTGADHLHWMRINPQIVDIYKFHKMDAYFMTHHHCDHCDIYSVKALLETTKSKFVGPKVTCMILRNWGVPEDRIVEVRPGDELKYNNMTVKIEKNFDINALRTTYGLGKEKSFKPTMDDVAVTFIFKNDAGSIAFIGDGIYHNGFYGVGQRNKIDVTVLNLGHNPSGSYDKLTPFDAYRVGKAMGSKYIIPDHYDNWACTYLPAETLEKVVQENDPTMKTILLKTGAKFIYPDDKDKGNYKYPDWQERMNWQKASYTLEDNNKI
ncbi:MBL fold metallo-hydrolase [Treponema parvum]|uniref:MBL fold metallo-hydrolase n=1 Tax=Treponema parvum TaxID=138851 RepID=UPI001AEC6A6D|nr:MBL fold metallo-hydrolase [Treponema parvum]QTQ16051.1 MBL fold metallo-hydrolase [Treponema parvum]